jgi:hypothetical protein
MSRRPNERELSKAEETAKSRVRENPTGGAKAENPVRSGALKGALDAVLRLPLGGAKRLLCEYAPLR